MVDTAGKQGHTMQTHLEQVVAHNLSHLQASDALVRRGKLQQLIIIHPQLHAADSSVEPKVGPHLTRAAHQVATYGRSYTCLSLSHDDGATTSL